MSLAKPSRARNPVQRRPHRIDKPGDHPALSETTGTKDVADVRPGYGYAGMVDAYRDRPAPSQTGVFRGDLERGTSELILSLAQIAGTGEIPQAAPGIKHYFNHLLFSPDGSRFIALHRWRYPNGRRLTRLITAAADGSDVRIVIPNGYASHFIWRDPKHILAQSKNLLGNPQWGNFLFEDKENGILREIGHGVLDPAGHLSYLPGAAWILNDTYPQGPVRPRSQTAGCVASRPIPASSVFSDSPRHADPPDVHNDLPDLRSPYRIRDILETQEASPRRCLRTG